MFCWMGKDLNTCLSICLHCGPRLILPPEKGTRVNWAHQTNPSCQIDSWNTAGWTKYPSNLVQLHKKWVLWSRRRAETSWGSNGPSHDIKFKREVFVYLLLITIFLTREFIMTYFVFYCPRHNQPWACTRQGESGHWRWQPFLRGPLSDVR